VYIEQEGKQRPLGLPVLEDKIVQKAAAFVLDAIYEQDFLSCSYGYRPGRGPQDALNAVFRATVLGKTSYVLDVDIKGYFQNIVHEHLMTFIQQRIKDRSLLRLIGKWLHVGVLEDGQLLPVTKGTVQGAVISPILANVYLHYVLDEWMETVVKPRLRGEMHLIRFADDFIVCFQHREDAERVASVLRKRLAKYGLELHEGKTQLIAFGRFAEENLRRQGQGKPPTFDFLGFTHVCGKTKSGSFALRRITIAKRKRTKLRRVKEELTYRRFRPIPEQGQWLASVVRGHCAYYAVPGNYDAVDAFRAEVTKLWYRALRRRSQRTTITWERMSRIQARWLPPAKIMHPWPNVRFDAKTQGRSPVW